jgi:formate dehydrogenase iron-sulfur subunit
MSEAVEIARAAHILGPNVLGSAHAFDIEIRSGAGAYVCGEETSLLNSLEGKRGTVRAKPPLPALQGFLGRPTVVNNVISLASVPVIMERGADFYRDFGMGRSRGTIPIQIAGTVKHGGLFETAFGLTLGQIIDDAGISVFDDRADMLKQARFAMEFCAIESCGKCTPCRIGSTRGVETVDKIRAGIEPDKNKVLLEDLCNTMKFGSLCALGGFTPYPVMSAMTHFPEDFAPVPMVEAAE